MGENINQPAPLGMLFRSAQVGKIELDSRTVELAFSSELPVDRYFGAEILDHSKESVVMDWISSGRAPLLADHDPTIQIGVIESARIDKDRIGRAVVRFGKGAQADYYFQDVQDGIRKNISVGYMIHKMILEEETADKAIYRASLWEPLEISIVSIPADPSVGIGRADEFIKIITPPKKERKTEINMDNNIAPTPQPTPSIQIDPDKVRADFIKENQARTNEIMALAKRHDMMEKGIEYAASGKSLEDFRAFILDNIIKPTPIDTGARDNGKIGLTDSEAGNFSLVRAVNAVITNDWKKAGFEREVVLAAGEKFKSRTFKGQLQIPTEVLFAGSRNNAAPSQRDLMVSNSTLGGYTVATKMGSFIDMLQNKLLVKQLGATVISGLDGDVTFPKETSIPSHYWVNEGGDITESTPTFGVIKISPKTVGAFTEVTRKMLIQSSLDIENWLRNRLAFSLARGIDRAALKGSGDSGEPLGILNTSGIGVVTISSGTYTYGKLVDLETEVAIDNADLGSLAYLTSATDRGIMKKTEKASSTGQYLWSNVSGQPGVGEVNGYYGYATNQLAANETIFGNWQDLYIGEWGMLDLIVNPFVNDKSGGVRIRALQDVDTALARAESFAKTSL